MLPKSEPKLSDERSNRSTARVAIYTFALVGINVLFTLFAVWLNGELYKHRAPFFDSLSYHEQCFRAMYDAEALGTFAAMRQHVQGEITVCVPQLMAIAMSRLMEPSRVVGIAIQSVFLIIFQLTLFAFLLIHQRLTPFLSLLGSVFFLATGCILFPVGGLSDFRMDLLLWLNYSTTVLLFLIAIKMQKESEQFRWTPFVLTGLAAAIACLCRATAPVYLLAALLPIALLQLWFAKDHRGKLMAGLAIAAVVTAAGSLWFYILNFEHLRFYYLVWNTDANAGLTHWESLGHIHFVRKSLGTPLLVFIALAWFVTLISPTGVRSDNWKCAHRNRTADYWTFVWLALIPIGMLVAKRAGMNPFVSIPACLGVILISIVPLLQLAQVDSRQGKIRLTVAVLVALFASLAVGKYQHQRSKFNSMAGQKAVLQRMVEHSRPGANVSFCVTTLAQINTSSLMSILLFDVAAEDRQPEEMTWQQRTFRPQRLYLIAAEADWLQLEGQDTDEKLDALFRQSTRSLQFVIVPDEPASRQLMQDTRNRVINGHADALRRRFVDSPNWRQVGEPIEASGDLKFLVMKNLSSQ